jgi:hypothetical protein
MLNETCMRYIQHCRRGIACYNIYKFIRYIISERINPTIYVFFKKILNLFPTYTDNNI